MHFLIFPMKPKLETESEKKINFYFEKRMSSNYKAEEKKLREIVDKHISCGLPFSEDNLENYFKPKKTTILFYYSKHNTCVLT